MYYNTYRGIARKTRTLVKFTSKQLNFFEGLFVNGVGSSSKLSAEQMIEKMKTHRNDGKLYFQPNEWVTPSKVKGLISRLNLKFKHSGVKRRAIEEEEGIIEDLNDICELFL